MADGSDKRDVASRVRFVLAGAFVAASLVVRAAFARLGSSAFPAWRHVTRTAMWAFAEVCRFVPFAVWDFAALALLVGGVVALVRFVRDRRPILPWLSHAALVCSLAALLFVCWALNHFAPPLADELGLDVGQYTTEELAQATEHYLTEAARLAPQVPREEDGSLIRQDFFELADIAGSSYEGLSGEYDVFGGSTAPVKALLVWGEPQLYSGHTGIFWAPTGEASVPLNCAIADMPFTMAHEVAHRMGVASEQEANFCAYLACVRSDDVRFAYAGNYSAFCYCVNALLRQDPERAQQVVDDVVASGLGDGVALVLADRTATRAHYDAYEGPFEEVGTTVNDTYLKSFGEDSGVRSYGLVVDYLIAWHQAAG